MRRSLSGTVLVGLLLLGCGDPTGTLPPSTQGTYSLVSVNGGPLPALIVGTTEARVSRMVSASRNSTVHG